ncbi:unnamed protein product [Prunus armeniaca]
MIWSVPLLKKKRTCSYSTPLLQIQGAFGPCRPFARRDVGFGLREDTTSEFRCGTCGSVFSDTRPNKPWRKFRGCLAGSVGRADRAFKVLRYGVSKVSIQVFIRENVPIESLAYSARPHKVGLNLVHFPCVMIIKIALAFLVLFLFSRNNVP